MTLVEKLRQDWKNLGVDVRKSKQLKIEKFDAVFSQTYSLLSKCSAESNVDKLYVGLIAEAYLFANIKDDTVDSSCLAAFVLTERMLNCCAFNVTTETAGASIYVFEVRKDVALDFNKVRESVCELSRIFEEVYWKKRM